jgi:hypothetical protein
VEYYIYLRFILKNWKEQSGILHDGERLNALHLTQKQKPHLFIFAGEPPVMGTQTLLIKPYKKTSITQDGFTPDQ